MYSRNAEIGIKIKSLRKDKGWTQKELAKKIGKADSSIRKYEKGITTIPLDVLEEISAVFNISIYDLCGFDEKLSKPKMRVGEMVEILISVHNRYRLTDKEDDALCEACNILDRLPRMSTVETIKEKLEAVKL